ncbi:MAG: CRTAC1 family protein [Planctomycetota bacterium]|nr:CRTAC1 family protein [Planctomycetota bacterium]
MSTHPCLRANRAMSRVVLGSVLLLSYTLLLSPSSCASREKFLHRSAALLAARDHAELVAAAARRMNPSIIPGDEESEEIAARIRSALGRRLHHWTEVLACRPRITAARFDENSLEVEIQSEVDGHRSDGQRASYLWTDEVVYRFDEQTGQATLTDWTATSSTEIAAGPPVYRDGTVEAGLDDTVQRPDRVLDNHIVVGLWSGCGAAAIDYDRDGWMDIFAGDGRRSILYRNIKGKRFEDVTSVAGLPDLLATGVLAFDYDGDGWTDLLTLSHFGRERLFRNREGRLEEVTEAARLGKARKGTSAASADIDGDGDLDLYVMQSGDYFAVQGIPPWNARNGYPNILYRNEGDGTFTDISESASVDSTAWSLAGAFGDLDDDGDPDLYVANDFGLNQYFENLGGGEFREATARAGLGDRGYGMGVSIGDYDRDGRLDLYTSNIDSPYGFIYEDPDLPLPWLGRIFRWRIVPYFVKMMQGNTLFRGLGDGRFEEAPVRDDVSRGGWAWAGSFLDFDNDGNLDIYSPNGFDPGIGVDSSFEFFIDSVCNWEEYLKGEKVFETDGRPLQGAERNRLFRQTPEGAFHEIGFVSGAGEIACARGLVIADFDRDGDLDLYLRNYEARSTYLVYEGRKRHWLQVDLVGDRKNSAGVGARVIAVAGDLRQTREAFVGQSYLSGHSPILHFGLGERERVDLLEIRWPDGTIQRIREIPADRRLTIRKSAEDRRFDQP